MKIEYNPQLNIFEESSVESLLPQVMWHVTDKCMLNCKTCYAKKRVRELRNMSQTQIEEYLLCLKQLGVQKIDISGGEPLLFEELPFLVDKARENGIYVTITTRGIGNSENYEWLVHNWKSFSRIIVSLDGPNDSICDFYSSYRGTMQSALSLCSDLKENKCNILRINTVVNQLILPLDIIEEFGLLLNQISPREWCLIQPHPLNKRREYDTYSVDNNEFLYFCEKIKRQLTSKATRLLMRNNDMYSTYWALQNDGVIMRLSTGSGYDYAALLSIDQLCVIKEYISNCIQKLPMNGGN